VAQAALYQRPHRQTMHQDSYCQRSEHQRDELVRRRAVGHCIAPLRLEGFEARRLDDGFRE